ncbi:MAG: sporulation protein YqfD [Bacillota bacterium]|jgi:similar to stage IV sporulation protein
MLLGRLWRFLAGYLVVSVQGPFLERFLNLAIKRGFAVWQIERQEHELRLRMEIEDFFAIRPVARLTHARVRIVRRAGLPFIAMRLQRRRALMASALFFCIVLYTLSSFIWFVDVRGTETVTPEIVVVAAAGLGLKPGVLRWQVDEQFLENELPKLVRGVSWVGITRRGTRVVVEVVEKELPPPPALAPPVRIFARKDALITHILAINGVAVVEPGDTVAAGDLLLRGYLTGEAPVPTDAPESAAFISPAEGTVRGRVWYGEEAVVPLIQRIPIQTGRQYRVTTLKIGQKEIMLTGRNKPPFAHGQQRIERRSLPGWRSIQIPVETTIITWSEIIFGTERLTPEQARERARAEAYGKIATSLPAGANILRVMDRVVEGEQGSVTVRVTVEVEEEIGMPGEEKWVVPEEPAQT